VMGELSSSYRYTVRLSAGRHVMGYHAFIEGFSGTGFKSSRAFHSLRNLIKIFTSIGAVPEAQSRSSAFSPHFPRRSTATMPHSARTRGGRLVRLCCRALFALDSGMFGEIEKRIYYEFFQLKISRASDGDVPKGGLVSLTRFGGAEVPGSHAGQPMFWLSCYSCQSRTASCPRQR
jgi:hypothetical protein